MRLRAIFFIQIILILQAFSCSTGRIPNTDVADTRENRDLVAIGERYRQAVERRDVETLLALASPNYYEDGGTPDGSDDYGIDGLRRLLSVWNQEVREVRYEIRYRRITFEREGERAMIDYTYTGSFTLQRTPLRVPEGAVAPRESMFNTDPARPMANQQPGSDDVWYRRVADNRLELERYHGQWRIVAGM